MAAIKCATNSGAVTLVASTAKTVLQLLAASNHRVTVTGFSVTVKGTNPVDLIVEVLRQTSAGSGSSSATCFMLDDDDAGTLQTTAIKGCTSEPTADSPARILQYKNLQGSYEKLFPFGQEIIVSGGDRLGIRCTCTTAETVAAEFFYEE